MKTIGQSQVARSLPFDPTRPGASGLAATDTQGAIEEIWASISGSTATVTPPFVFSRSGNSIANGTYLWTGNVATSLTGQIIRGNAYLVAAYASNSKTFSSGPALFKVQYRTGLTTFADLTGATFQINNGTYFTETVFSSPGISVGTNLELAVQFISGGGGPRNPVIVLYFVPQ